MAMDSHTLEIRPASISRTVLPMTSAEVGAAADRIAHLLGLDEPSRYADAARWAEVQALREVLRTELGRRLGWTWGKGARGAEGLLGQRPRDGDMDRPPGADHGSHYRIGRRVMALVEQPYRRPDDDAAGRSDMHAWAAARGLALTVPDFPSWWYPGRTALCLFHRPGAGGV